MSIINLEMSDITFVDLPVQAIMVYVVEEPEPEEEPKYRQEPEYAQKPFGIEDICAITLLSPIVIPMLCIGIPVALSFALVAVPIIFLEKEYKKCKNRN